jgi:hypothetical protein
MTIDSKSIAATADNPTPAAIISGPGTQPE